MDDRKSGNHAATTDVLWRLLLSGSVTWRLSVDGRNEVAIPGFEGWSMVTPTGCARMDLPCDKTDWPYNGSGLLRTVDNKIFVSEHDLWIRYKGTTTPSRPSEVGKSTLS